MGNFLGQCKNRSRKPTNAHENAKEDSNKHAKEYSKKDAIKESKTCAMEDLESDVKENELDAKDSVKEVVVEIIDKKGSHVPELIKDILSTDQAVADTIPTKTSATTSKLSSGKKGIYGMNMPRKYRVFRAGCQRRVLSHPFYGSSRSERIPISERPMFMVRTLFLLSAFLAVTYGLLLYDRSSITFAILIFVPFSTCSHIEPGNLFVITAAVITVTYLLIKYYDKRKWFGVIIVPMATAIVMGFLFFLACTPFNFAHWMLYVVALLLTGLVLLVVHYVVINNFNLEFTTMAIVYCCVATLYYVLCICVQIQLILVGCSIDIDETHFITAAFMLYMSFLYTFIEIIRGFWVHYFG